MGYSPWGHKELDTTERLSTHIIPHKKMHPLSLIVILECLVIPWICHVFYKLYIK